MRGPDDWPEGTVVTPGAIAYRELAYQESARLVGYLFLLTGDGPRAEALATDAFNRTWELYRRGDILGDAEEQLYRRATREALRWMQRSGNTRGYQAPTTSREQDIVAMGVVSGFPIQQRAAVLLAAWGGIDERTTSVATSVGEERVRDLIFAARQEYHEGTGRDDFEATLRGLRISANQEAVRDEALDVPSVVQRRRNRPLTRIRRVAGGPALLVITLLVLVVVFHDCGGPTIKTGAGRTSDVVYARAGASIVVIDTGTGHELGRVPAGVLSVNGEHVYSARAGCGGQQGATTVSQSDTEVMKTTDIGCAAGLVAPVAVDEAGGLLYVTSGDASSPGLQELDLGTLAVKASARAPSEAPSMFASVLAPAPDRSALFGAAGSDVGATPSAVVQQIDLPTLQLGGAVRFPADDASALQLIAISGGRVLAYGGGTSTLRELNPGGGEVVSVTDLPGQGTSASAGAPHPRTIALSTDEQTLYVAPPGGGISVLDLARGQMLRRLNPDQRYVSIGLSTDASVVYAIEAGGVYVVLDSGTGRALLRRQNSGLTELLQVNPGQ